MMSLSKLAVIGECMAELSGFEADSISLKWGGDVLNTAIYCKRVMEGSVELSVVTAMGTDHISQRIIDDWHSEGLDTQHVMLDPYHHVGLYAIANQPNGERSFTYWRNDSAAKYMLQHARSKNIFEALVAYDAVYFSGISLAILPRDDRQNLIAQLRQLKSRGTKIVFDGNYRERLWESKKEAQVLYQQAYELADLLLLTLDDEIDLWDDHNLDACALRLSKFDEHELVIKSGADGCYYFNRLIHQQHSELIHFPGNKVNHVTDTTAAGDSFNGGYLAAWLSGQKVDMCASMANNLASQVIQKQGAIVPIDIDLVNKTDKNEGVYFDRTTHESR